MRFTDFPAKLKEMGGAPSAPVCSTDPSSANFCPDTSFAASTDLEANQSEEEFAWRHQPFQGPEGWSTNLKISTNGHGWWSDGHGKRYETRTELNAFQRDYVQKHADVDTLQETLQGMDGYNIANPTAGIADHGLVEGQWFGPHRTDEAVNSHTSRLQSGFYHEGDHGEPTGDAAFALDALDFVQFAGTAARVAEMNIEHAQGNPHWQTAAQYVAMDAGGDALGFVIGPAGHLVSTGARAGLRFATRTGMRVATRAGMRVGNTATRAGWDAAQHIATAASAATEAATRAAAKKVSSQAAKELTMMAEHTSVDAVATATKSVAKTSRQVLKKTLRQNRKKITVAVGMGAGIGLAEAITDGHYFDADNGLDPNNYNPKDTITEEEEDPDPFGHHAGDKDHTLATGATPALEDTDPNQAVNQHHDRLAAAVMPSVWSAAPPPMHAHQSDNTNMYMFGALGLGAIMVSAMA